MTAVDKTLVKRQFTRGLKSYAKEAGVQKQMAKKLIEQICLLNLQELPRLFEVGSGTGFLTRNIIENISFDHLMVNDITAISKEKMLELETVYGTPISFIEGDAEEIVFPEQLNAVISGSTIQWFKDTGAFFNKASLSLMTGGLLAFSTFGCHNFREIRRVTNTGLDYLCLHDLTILLSSHFNILWSDEWTEIYEFDCPVDVLRHMKQTGVNAISRKPFGKKQLNDFSQSYQALFSTPDQTVTLTYNPIIVIAQKK